MIISREVFIQFDSAYHVYALDDVTLRSISETQSKEHVFLDDGQVGALI